MQAIRLSPPYVVRHEEDLDLDEAQVTKIEALADAHRMAPDRMTEMQSLHQRLEQAFTAIPADTAGIRAALERLASLHGRMHADHLSTAASLRAILTPAQRTVLEQLPRRA